jgi:hypothetical protein
VALSIPLSSWLLCESLIRWAGSWQQGEIDAAAETLQLAIIEAADSGGLHGQVRQHVPAAARHRLPASRQRYQLRNLQAIPASQHDPHSSDLPLHAPAA